MTPMGSAIRLGVVIVLHVLLVMNFGALYYHQAVTGKWLPVKAEGKWRGSLVKTAIKQERNAQSFERNAGLPYEMQSNEEKAAIDVIVSRKYPPEWVEKHERDNAFLKHVQQFGMWQFPLAFIALLSSLAGIAYGKVKWRRITYAGLACISAICFADAFYRSYFGALGW